MTRAPYRDPDPPAADPPARVGPEWQHAPNLLASAGTAVFAGGIYGTFAPWPWSLVLALTAWAFVSSVASCYGQDWSRWRRAERRRGRR